RHGVEGRILFDQVDRRGHRRAAGHLADARQFRDDFAVVRRPWIPEDMVRAVGLVAEEGYEEFRKAHFHFALRSVYDLVEAGGFQLSLEVRFSVSHGDWVLELG